MKISLIHPHYREGIPGRFPSLGPGYIAAVLEKNGYDVDYIDIDGLDLTEKDLRDCLSKTTPNVIGITCNSPTFGPAKKTAKIARESCDAFIVIGGPHVSIYPKETVQNSEFDAGIYGEGEYTMLELARALETNRGLSGMQGLIYKEDNEVIANPPRALIRNLDNLPFPARHLMPNEKYNSPMVNKHPFTTMIISRGCPFKCFYCRPVYRGIPRYRSAKNVADEIESCIDKFGIQEIQFYDDTFTVNEKLINEICDEIIDRRLDIIWDCRTRVDLVNKDLLKKMKTAGCYRIRYGVESGDQDMLKIMKTGVTLNRVRTTFKQTKEAGIETLAYFMIGTPGETMEKIQKTINFAKELNPDCVRFSITTAYPGTELYDTALRERWLDRDVWRDYTLGLIDIPPNPIFETAEYKRKDLENIIEDIYEEFPTTH